jgi:hypothetical protein
LRECATALVAMLGQNSYETTTATPSSPEPDDSMAIYEGSCNNQVACNGDASGETGCQDWYSAVDVNVNMGNSYFIRIGGWEGETGSGTLTIGQ